MNARRAQRAFAAAVALFAALVVTVHVIRLPEPLGVDQGLFACFARWVPRGWLPYRDLYDSKPPLFLYWWACSAIIPGDVVRAAWWWEGLWLGGTLVMAYALGSRTGGRAAIGSLTEIPRLVTGSTGTIVTATPTAVAPRAR